MPPPVHTKECMHVQHVSFLRDRLTISVQVGRPASELSCRVEYKAFDVGTPAEERAGFDVEGIRFPGRRLARSLCVFYRPAVLASYGWTFWCL